MPFSLNGIGTKFYGHRMRRDGAFVITNWIVVLNLPIMPLGTYETTDWGGTKSWGLYEHTPYTVKRTRLDLLHIGSVYLLMIAAIAVIGAVSWIFK